jgi:hypothetical protein
VPTFTWGFVLLNFSLAIVVTSLKIFSWSFVSG